LTHPVRTAVGDSAGVVIVRDDVVKLVHLAYWRATYQCQEQGRQCHDNDWSAPETIHLLPLPSLYTVRLPATWVLKDHSAPEIGWTDTMWQYQAKSINRARTTNKINRR